jgi:hypothetical protein
MATINAVLGSKDGHNRTTTQTPQVLYTQAFPLSPPMKQPRRLPAILHPKLRGTLRTPSTPSTPERRGP